MVDPGFWRELFVRAGLTGTLAVVAIVLLDADPWILALPAGVALLVTVKWHPWSHGGPDGRDDRGGRDDPDA